MRKRGKHEKEVDKKNLMIIIICVLCLSVSVFGNISYSKYKSELKQETFNVNFVAGDIKLLLSEGENNLIVVPGNKIAKEAKITVQANSEACYLFIKVDKASNFDTYMSYEIDEEWTELPDETGVFYRESPKSIEDTDFYILKNNQIIAKDTVNREEMKVMNESDMYFKLMVYAVQKTNNITNALEAWEMVK